MKVLRHPLIPFDLVHLAADNHTLEVVERGLFHFVIEEVVLLVHSDDFFHLLDDLVLVRLVVALGLVLGFSDKLVLEDCVNSLDLGFAD